MQDLSDDAAGDPARTLLRLEPACATLSALSKLDLKNQALVSIPASLAVCCRLEHLDIGGNVTLRSLDGIERLPMLRILFAKGCSLGPKLQAGGPLSQAASIFMLGIADVGLTELDGAALPPSLGWLIAPQNAISVIKNPTRLGSVRKLMLSHNHLDAFAADRLIDAIPALEMVRLACNQLETVPPSAFAHPRLAWLAIGGNPYAKRAVDAALTAASGGGAGVAGAGTTFLPDASEVEVDETVLGQGSGAVVKRGAWRGKPVAVKLWSAERFSDGDARGEWVAGRLTGDCPDLVRTLAAWESPSLGMALELLEGASAVGGPPNFGTVTRDAFTDGKQPKLGVLEAFNVAVTVARAGEWLHTRGLMHGDVYLHNTLRVAGSSRALGRPPRAMDDIVRLSDLGAACAYDRGAHAGLEKIEVRSFGWLVHDLLSWIAPGPYVQESKCLGLMREVANACTSEELSRVPSFSSALAQLRTATEYQVLSSGVS